MPGFLSPGKGVPLLLISEYSESNKGQRVPDRSKTAHRKPLVKCFLTPGNLPDLGIELGSLALQVDFLPAELQGIPPHKCYMVNKDTRFSHWESASETPV